MNGTRKQDIEFKLLSKLQSIASNSLQHMKKAYHRGGFAFLVGISLIKASLLVRLQGSSLLTGHCF